MPVSDLIVRGFWYSGTILAILGCHELGHYFACRYYDVDASLPFFLPVPPPMLTGTLGAFIRIRQPIPSKRMLFDIGIAGPIAGFLVAVPALFIGVAMSHVVRIPDNISGMLELGEPLLFRLAAWVCWGTPPDGYSLNMHPMAFAAWFGLLATALNLFPIGQLDGGHIWYAVLGQRSTYVTFATIGVAIALSAFFSTSWIVWTALTIVMLFDVRPAASTRLRRRRAARSIPADSGRLCAADVRPLLHACADSADGADRTLRSDSDSVSRITVRSGSTSTTTRRCTSGRAASAACSA